MWEVTPSITSVLNQLKPSYINDIQFIFCSTSGLLIMKTKIQFQTVFKTINKILGKRKYSQKTTMKYESISYLNTYA